MATLALSLAGQVVGGAIGGPIGATIGRALGALAGSAIDSALFGEKPAPATAPAPISGCRARARAAPIPRLYGWSRLSGNIIWATELEELDGGDAGAKGTARRADDGADDRRELRGGALRGRGGAARPRLGRRAAARHERRDHALLSRHARRRRPTA